ncbi:adenylate/guanylate cyclase domain-containing protein [Amycolatopsis sp. DG1A-15b]|uniref:adenylate/guanylate cyclase domain-containing protein n=1 Tax=Amycolatopsis sp. DG1A-15b TaxID=3052846 RepID=UPI00255B4985|nr:adenylate/guanylate cyclase domain-containing protein [Amycolatopsis sp. DG1A-15b]WIX90168.1 adenylate/guanylate cyclase domain-containing protein [Amycolatopsis sp. DG1A-15b]
MNPGRAPAEPFGSGLLGPLDQHATALRRRVQGLLTAALIATNVIGALVVVGLAALLMPAPGMSGELVRVTAVAVPVYVVSAVVAGTLWGTRGALRTLRWAADGRRPTDAERAASLRVPLRLTFVQAVLWGIATLVFGGLAALVQPEVVLTEFLVVAFAAVVVCAIAYLFGEFALRPYVALALAGTAPPRPVNGGVNRRMLLFWCLGTGVPVAGLVVTAVLAWVRGDVSTTKLAVSVIALGLVVLCFGLLVTVFTARSVVNPISSVRDALGRVRAGDFAVEIPVYDGTELGLLQAGFNDMTAGLAERERLRDLFGKHVGHEVAVEAMRTSTGLGGTVRTVSVLFVDLVGSTALAASRPPEEVVGLLNRFFAVVVDEVDRHHGLVNKFVGDAALAVFGAPAPLGDHATCALAAGRAIARRLAAEVPDGPAGIGVATGDAVAGNVGDPRRFEYTVIGDPVNEAARLTELAKNAPGRLLASWTAVESAAPDEAARWTATGDVTLRGRTRPTTLASPRQAGGPPGGS